MRVDLACGGNNFSIDEALSDNCEVRCGDCTHRIGTLADLKERVAHMVLAKAQARRPMP